MCFSKNSVFRRKSETHFRGHPTLYSVLYGIISKRRCLLPRNCSLEKNQVPRELTPIAISLACLVAHWNSYGGSWKWVTILPNLVGIVQLLFAICFCNSFTCAPTTAFTWLTKFGTLQLSSVFYTYLGTSPGAEFHVLYHTSLRNYAYFSLQVPSILSILLGTGPNQRIRYPPPPPSGR